MRRAAIVGVALVLIGLAWATRWQVMHTDNDHRLVYLLQRWTGEMRVLSGEQWAPIELAPSRSRTEEPATSR